MEKTQHEGVMYKFTYRSDPRHKPNEVFDLVMFFDGSDHARIKNNALYHARKTGAIAVKPITPQQYEDMLNEKTESTTTTIIAQEENQKKCLEEKISL